MKTFPFLTALLLTLAVIPTFAQQPTPSRSAAAPVLHRTIRRLAAIRRRTTRTRAAAITTCRAASVPAPARWKTITKLSKQERQAIYRESQAATDAAEKDAQKRYPLPELTRDAPVNLAYYNLAYYKTEGRLSDALSVRYIAKIARRHHLTEAQMHDIFIEGLSQCWPYEGFSPTKECLDEQGLTGVRVPDIGFPKPVSGQPMVRPRGKRAIDQRRMASQTSVRRWGTGWRQQDNDDASAR